MTENDLINRCKKGSREAFNELVLKYQTRVINIAYGMLSDREDALDAAQETFVRVYKNIESFKEQSSLTTWIYRITSNVCADILRKRQKGSNIISLNKLSDDNKETDIKDDAPTPEDSAELSERQRAVREAIARLGDEYRTVITLCDMEGLSYDEIAAILKIPSGTVKSRINRARNSLKKILMEKRELF